jgi:hypothetical protein
MSKTYKWTVQFEVSENWIDDGFNINDETALNMLAEYLPYAYGHELKAKVIKSPKQLED